MSSLRYMQINESNFVYEFFRFNNEIRYFILRRFVYFHYIVRITFSIKLFYYAEICKNIETFYYADASRN